MPNFQINDSQKAAYSVTEFDSNGSPVAALPGDVITVISSNTAALTVVPDATPTAGANASGFIVTGTTPANNVGVTATLSHSDGTSLTTTMFVDVVAGPANTLVLKFSAPVAKP